jgi:hypothetical protein
MQTQQKQTQVKKYGSMNAATNDIRNMARNGWTAGTPVPGDYKKAIVLMWILLGPINFLRPTTPRSVTVIYTR